ncbi:hypothetical protein K432DRAFT_312287 [Lepidopterella palustris CBS 459.81]|uniref:Asteroid domain-containing protein n=1 Tax=Lepidopterella palustris CBS 459.81 TaxID=1314670 RepID=A0A8E2J8Y9_9PEZI|nr:hypothetical protein K432DRAFT_312287 [Lepidopterella palustris CBS 459.81]
MGIPRLTSSLEPFAERIQFSSNDSGAPKSAVIDGPGLAFHICNQSLGYRTDLARASPSYAELSSRVVQWVRQLQQTGPRIDAIYFDGVLPKFKKAERLSRLQSSLTKLQKFRSNHSFEPNPAVLGSLNTPFLVPTIIEALLASEFCDKTTVVPGEADSWCAHHAKRFGSVVFTNDSDLFAYDLGPRGSVMLFQDRQFSSSCDGPDVTATRLIGLRFRPAAIAKRLGLKSILPLAYVMTQDFYKSFNEHVDAARKLITDGTNTDFAIFSEQFSFPPAQQYCLTGLNENDASSLQHSLGILDPRISEFVHQALSASSIPDEDAQPMTLDMYLPFLIEDPIRASAWNYGSEIRRLGYSIITPTTNHPTTIAEFSRRGERITERQFSLHPTSTTLSTCIHQSNTLQTWITTFSSLPPALSWRLFAIYLILQDLIPKRNPPFHRNHIKQALTNSTPGKDWDSIHFAAQLQAVLYSLRMLHQITSICLAASQKFRSPEFVNTVPASQQFKSLEFVNTVTSLHECLRTLPPLTELFPMKVQDTGAAAIEDEEMMAVAITKMYGLLGVEEPVLAPDTKKKRKAKAGGKENRSPALSLKKPLNIYSILSES